MKQETKIGLIIGGVVILGLGVSAYLYFRVNKKDDTTDKTGISDDIILAPTSGGGSSSSPKSCDHPVTPFKNRDQGNKFRLWINENYPDYAKKIDLDPSGEYNNCFIRRAWKDYGSSYSFSSNAIVSGITDFFTPKNA